MDTTKKPVRRRHEPEESDSPPTYGDVFAAIGQILELAGHEVDRDWDEPIDEETNEFWCRLVDLVRRLPSMQVGRKGAHRIERGDLSGLAVYLDLVFWLGRLRSRPKAHAREVDELQGLLGRHGLGEGLGAALRALSLKSGDEAPLANFRELAAEKGPSNAAKVIVSLVTPSNVKSLEFFTRSLPNQRRRKPEDGLESSDERTSAVLLAHTSPKTVRLRGAAFAVGSKEVLELAEASLMADLGEAPDDG